MTVAPVATRAEFDGIEQAIATLRERGLRVSAPRRLLLEALFDQGEPVSAERIAGSLRLDSASVYRNLEAFERHGLVRHVHLGHGPGLYALVGGGEREFAYCSRCGAVRSLSAEEMDPVRSEIARVSGFTARFDHHAIVGVCGDCGESARHPPTLH